MRYAILFLMCCLMSGCSCSASKDPNGTPVSISGVGQATTTVTTDASGHTTEQNNVIERLKRDNEHGSNKHLYVISGMTGQVLLYSPVKGKVTSSGKRLSPTTLQDWWASGNGYVVAPGTKVTTPQGQRYTQEAIQDDGTYGSSIEYLYWFTPDGRYHQQYLGGGVTIHIADQPINVKNVIISIESHKE